MHGICGVTRLSEAPTRPSDSDADELRDPVRTDSDQLGSEVGMGGRARAINHDTRHAEDSQRLWKWKRRVDEQIVPQFQRRLVELATLRRRSAGGEDWNFWIVDEDITRLVRCGRRR